jgi:CRISPR-associated protein (TIGR03986 family)
VATIEAKIEVDRRGTLRVVGTIEGQTKRWSVGQGAWSEELTAWKAADPVRLADLPVIVELEQGVPRRVRPRQPLPEQPPGATAPAAAARPAVGAQAAPSPRPASPLAPSPKQRPAPSRPSDPQGRFHNPYNFVPVPPRDWSDAHLGDGRPKGHDAYQPGCWSGWIDITLDVVTPLLIPGEVERRGDGHVTVGLRVDGAGRPLLPATSLKGMLRAAYEAATNARLGVFSRDWARPLGFRLPARDAQELIPVRIERTTDDSLVARPLRGTLIPGAPRTLAAAWLPRYPQDRAVCYPSGDLPAHGDHVRCLLEARQHRSKRFWFWEVVCITPVEEPLPQAKTEVDRGHSGRIEVEGWVFVTNRNAPNKHDERVFFAVGDVHRLPLSADVVQQWKELIADYRRQHDEAEVWGRQGADGRLLPPDVAESGPSGELRPAWSPHIYQDGRTHPGVSQAAPDLGQLAPGTLGYARLEGWGAAGAVVTELYPVALSRAFYARAPLDLLDESLRPASSLDQCSPAERVFGWVNPAGPGAVRGHLRVGPVRCETAPDQAVQAVGGAEGIPLAVLSTPKPAQARFYLASDPCAGKPLPQGWQVRRSTYAPPRALRGRKVYPHHRGLEGKASAEAATDYWCGAAQPPPPRPGPRYREYRRAGDLRDGQNRSVRAWVRPGTRFAARLWVDSLAPAELGALLWLLRLPAAHYLRLGGGKPLGFGSVRVEISALELGLGEDWQRWYAGLGLDEEGIAWLRDPQDRRLGACVEVFGAAVRRLAGLQAASDWQTAPWIAAFLRACRGHDDPWPVHYPRTQSAPDPKGENFRWFVANASPKGLGLALPPLLDEDQPPAARGLPLSPVRRV